MDLKVSASVDLQKVLLGLEQQAAKVGELTPTIAEMLLGAVHDVFEAEGPGWEPLKAATLAHRRNEGSHKILQDTGHFAGTIDKAHGPDYAEAFSAVSYAVFHVTGTKFMPKRNPFDLGPFEGPLLDEVAKLIGESVTA